VLIISYGLKRAVGYVTVSDQPARIRVSVPIYAFGTLPVDGAPQTLRIFFRFIDWVELPHFHFPVLPLQITGNSGNHDRTGSRPVLTLSQCIHPLSDNECLMGGWISFFGKTGRYK